MLNFDKAWRFESPASISDGVVRDFYEFIARIVGQFERRKPILEHFKGHFAGPAGRTYTPSSDESWAQSDLSEYMWDAAKNAPLFIEAFYDACQALERQNPDLGLPDVARINRAFFENEAPWEIRPPNLIATGGLPPISSPEPVASFTQQAQTRITESLAESERLLAEGRDRPAVQEVLWLLETVTTAFQGLEIETGTVQGKYFNKIAEDLRRHHKGQTLEQVLGWTTQLHGYLSSPTGGGIRHGADLRADIVLLPHEARLYCNLIRSYVYFLMSEHERLSVTR
jgi:hypothetical protein